MGVATRYLCDPMGTREDHEYRDTLLDVGQVATMLGTSERFVRRCVFERRIVFYRIGRHLRFRRRDVDRLIEAGRVDPP